MKAIKRALDELGRIVLPREFRDCCGWEAGDAMELTQDEDGTIHIAPKELECKLCGGKKEVHNLGEGKLICSSCIDLVQSR